MTTDLLLENKRLHKELTEAINGRDREYNRAESEHEQLTDAKRVIAEARGVLGSSTRRATFKELRVRLSRANAVLGSIEGHMDDALEPGTLADVFTREEADR